MGISFHLTPVSLLLILISAFPISYANAQNIDWANLELHVNLPDSFYVLLNNEVTNAQKVAPGQAFSVPTGLRQITIVSQYIDDYTFYHQVKPNQLNTYHHTFETFRLGYKSSYQQIISNQNLVIKTDSAATIYLDGKEIGNGTANLLLNPGQYQLKSVHPEFGSFTRNVRVRAAETEIVHRYNEYQSDKSPGLFILPGGGYIVTEQDQKLILTYLTMAGLGASYLTIEQKLNKDPSEYLYNHSKMRSLQKTALLTMGAVYLITTIDGFRKPKGGYPGGKIALKFDEIQFPNQSIPTAGLYVTF